MKPVTQRMIGSLVFALSAVGCGGTVGARAATTGVLLQLSIQGSGSVASSPLGVACSGPSTCPTLLISLPAGASLNLVPTPADGSTFVGWSLTAGALVQYPEGVDTNGDSVGGSYDAMCSAQFPTSDVPGLDVTVPDLAVPAGTQQISAADVSCATSSGDPALARAISVPLAYLLTANFAP